MSVQSTDRVAGPYACDGLTTLFPFDFKVFVVEDVVAILADADDVETDLQLGVDFTVALHDNQDVNPGGTVTTVVAHPTSWTITLTSDVPYTQPSTITNQGGFYPKVIEAALDRVTILAQQVAEGLGRSLKAPISGGSSATDLLKQLEEQLPLVTAVYGHLAEITAVVANQAGIDAVAGSVGSVNAVAGDLGGTWALGVMYDFGSISTAPVGNTSPPGGNIVTIANSIEDIQAVAANLSDLLSISLNLSSVLTVASNIVDVQTVAGDTAVINAVAANATNINTVANASTSINTVAVSIDGVNLVAVRMADVQTVASNAADITLLAENLDAILDALSGALVPANNLSELTDPAQARTNLGLADMGGLA